MTEENKTKRNIKNQANKHLEEINDTINALDGTISDYILIDDSDVRMSDLDDMFKKIKENVKKLKELREFAQ
jgi:hypothetical protein